MKNNWFLILLTLLGLASCQKEQEARKPVSYASGSFIRQSIARNKQILKEQDAAFTALIKKQPQVQFFTSKHGFRYFFNQRDTLQTKALPIKGDVVFFDYEVRTLKNQLIYNIDKFKNRQYQIDKENIMLGLREGLKLVKEGDVATFYLPSQMAYGFHGDGDKIISNTPLIVKVSIHKVLRQVDLLAEQARLAKLDSITKAIINDSIAKAVSATASAAPATLPSNSSPSNTLNNSVATKSSTVQKSTTTENTPKSNTDTKVPETKKPEVVLPPRKKVRAIMVPPIKMEVQKETIKNTPLLEQPIIINSTKSRK